MPAKPLGSPYAGILPVLAIALAVIAVFSVRFGAVGVSFADMISALHPFLSAEIMSANDTPTAPKRTEKTAITASAIASTGRIPAYGLPSGFAGMNQVLELQHVFTGARTDIHQVVFLDAKDSPILGCTGAVHAGQSRHLFGRAEPVIAEIGQQNHVRVRRGDDLRRELHHSSISADRNFPARPF